MSNKKMYDHFKRPENWEIKDYFTNEEISTAEKELAEMYLRKEQLAEYKVKEVERKTSIKPKIMFNDYLTQVVFFILDGDLKKNVRKGMLCNMWSQSQWPVIKEVIQKQSEDDTIIKMVEDFYDLIPVDQQLEFLVSLSSKEQRELGFFIKESETKQLEREMIIKYNLNGERND